MESPTPEEVKLAVAQFDTRQQKIVAGMLGAMIQEPQRVRDREWIAQQLTEMTLFAGEFEAESADEVMKAVQRFLVEHANDLLSASFLLFQRVGLDLQPRATAGFSFDEALRCGLAYLPSLDGEPPRAEHDAGS